MPHNHYGGAAACRVFLSVAAWNAAAPARAVDMFWSNTRGDGSGVFSNAVNWTSSVGGVLPPPGVGDVARFGQTTSDLVPKTYTVTFTAGATNQGLVVEDDRVTFDLNGHVYRTPSSIMDIGTVTGRSGRLTLINGSWDDNGAGFLTIGAGFNASGFLTISTGGNLFAKQIDVAPFGPGTLVVQNGGSVITTFVTLGQNAGGAATITGANSTLTSVFLNVGTLSTGTLNITAGGRVLSSGECFVGDQILGIGTINVDGPNSLWSNSSIVRLGRIGEGSANITAGARAELGSVFIGGQLTLGVGMVTVSGVNSQMTGSLHVGPFGDGTLNVSAGGFVRNLGAQLHIGEGGTGIVNITSGGRMEAAASTLGRFADGIVSVSGAGSQWVNTGALKVGEFGRGSLSITDGGLVQNASGFVGAGVPGNPGLCDATVDGLNSQWVNQGDLAVGSKKNGTLTITNRGRVSSVNGSIGSLSVNEAGIDGRGVGMVTVDGSGSEWVNSGTLTVGESGTGTLQITAVGLVQSANGFVGKNSGSTGAVIVDGSNSLWLNSADIHIGSGGDGVVTVANGGAVRATNVFVDSLGAVKGNGTIIGSVQNSGVVSPGASIGALQIQGAYVQQTDGTLEIEIGGNSGTHVDLLNVGAASLDGNLSLRLIAGVVPSVNVALTATSLSGQFDNVISGQRLNTVGGGGSFVVHYGPGSPFNPNHVVLTAFQSNISGDFDVDGDVDGLDFLVWQRGGSPNPVSAADLAIWRAHYGEGGSVTATSAAVPEPATLVLLMFAAAGLRVRRRNCT